MTHPPPPRDLEPVPPDSHRRSGYEDRWRLWMPVTLVLLLCGWRVFGSLVDFFPSASWSSPGRLSAVHAAWENDCMACHEPCSSTRGGRSFDARCKECHAGPEHHSTSGAPPGCASCHHEHRGRDVPLRRVADDRCTACHADLSPHVPDGRTSHCASVLKFAGTNHPEFRFRRENLTDPGQLKFNHRLHMMQGMQRGTGGKTFTLAEVDPRYLPVYRTQPDADMSAGVQLQCDYCHQRDSGDHSPLASLLVGVPVIAANPVRSPGAAMLPVIFEKHCQGCHPLTFERADPADPRSGLFAIPHRLQPDKIRGFLQAHYTAGAFHGPPVADRMVLPLPGKPPVPARPPGLDTSALIARAEHDLYLSQKTCGECHHWDRKVESLPPGRLSELHIRPTNVKAVWFEHALFDHTSHRQLACRACHPGAYPDPPEGIDSSETSASILLPGIATCQECHTPTGRGAARGDCVECHRYHDGGHTLAGRGSATRAGERAGTRTIADFLRPHR